MARAVVPAAVLPVVVRAVAARRAADRMVPRAVLLAALAVRKVAQLAAHPVQAAARAVVLPAAPT